METVKALESRQTIRKFKDKKVSDELLQKIISLGTKSPSAGNLQNYSILVTQDALRRKELAEIHFNQSAFKNAPVILTFCVDVRRTTEWCNLNSTEPGFENFWGFLLGMADAWSVAQSITLAAIDSGLASCHSGGTFIKVLNLIDFFDCPKGVIPVATLALGYPDEAPPTREKLPIDALVHSERYKVPTNDDLKKLYAKREQSEFDYYKSTLGVSDGFSNLAQLYTLMKYRKSETELFSTNYLSALKRQGFFSL